MEDFVPYNKWLHQHDDDIRQDFPHRPTEVLAGETGLNYYTVSRKATRMGVGKSDAFMHTSWKKGAAKKGGWKKNEMRAKNGEAVGQYMRDHFADTKNDDIARRFGVDVKTVRRWARKLGLVKSEEFMRSVRSLGQKKVYYTDEHQAWRRQRIAEVWPDGDDKALKALAEELGLSVSGVRVLANKLGIHRSNGHYKAALARAAEKRTKYGPEVIAALKEYYPDHTTAECAARFGISPGVITQLAIKHRLRKSREHLQKVRGMRGKDTKGSGTSVS